MQAVGDLCRRHRRDFIQPGACSEAERDRIEAEIGTYVKACTENIARLENGIPGAERVESGKAGINATTAAHCHGMVGDPLILFIAGCACFFALAAWLLAVSSTCCSLACSDCSCDSDGSYFPPCAVPHPQRAAAANQQGI